MNSKEFKKALDNIVKEKNIDPEVVYSAMELALTSAYKKNFNSKTNVKVLFDRETGEIKYYLKYKGKMWKDGNKSDGYYFKEY